MAVCVTWREEHLNGNILQRVREHCWSGVLF
jgi:hypothetical protein